MKKIQYLESDQIEWNDQFIKNNLDIINPDALLFNGDRLSNKMKKLCKQEMEISHARVEEMCLEESFDKNGEWQKEIDDIEAFLIHQDEHDIDEFPYLGSIQ